MNYSFDNGKLLPYELYFYKNNFLGISYLKLNVYKQEFTLSKLHIACVQI